MEAAAQIRSTTAELQPHPLADLFPMMGDDDFAALVNDIRAYGQREPIVLFEDMILDGRNRYRACSEIGIEPKLKEWDRQGAPQAFVTSLNLHRRHLNESQRSMIASRMAKLEVGRPGKGETAEISAVISQTEAAKLLNVNRSTVQHARVVLEKGRPEEIKAVDDGKRAVSTVAKAIRDRTPKPARGSNAQKAEILRRASADTDRNRQRIATQRLNSKIYGQLRDAVLGLSEMPNAKEVARIALGLDRAGVVKSKLVVAINWMKDFEDAWNAPRE